MRCTSSGSRCPKRRLRCPDNPEEIGEVLAKETPSPTEGRGSHACGGICQEFAPAHVPFSAIKPSPQAPFPSPGMAPWDPRLAAPDTTSQVGEHPLPRHPAKGGEFLHCLCMWRARCNPLSGTLGPVATTHTGRHQVLVRVTSNLSEADVVTCVSRGNGSRWQRRWFEQPAACSTEAHWAVPERRSHAALKRTLRGCQGVAEVPCTYDGRFALWQRETGRLTRQVWPHRF
jgi:hypothetical protein